MLSFISLISGPISTGLMALLLAWYQHKWKREDERHDSVKNLIKEQEKAIKALVAAQKIMMVDRVAYLGEKYIADGEVRLGDKDNLHEMHTAYKELGGNGHLDTVMNEVNRLKVITR